MLSIKSLVGAMHKIQSLLQLSVLFRNRKPEGSLCECDDLLGTSGMIGYSFYDLFQGSSSISLKALLRPYTNTLSGDNDTESLFPSTQFLPHSLPTVSKTTGRNKTGNSDPQRQCGHVLCVWHKFFLHLPRLPTAKGLLPRSDTQYVTIWSGKLRFLGSGIWSCAWRNATVVWGFGFSPLPKCLNLCSRMCS